jgi:hypothetical protein
MSIQVVNNTGTNYTLYYNVLNYFKTIMSNHPSIEAVTTGDLWDLGERQYPSYPLGNIQILETDFGTNVTNYKCQLIIADKIKNRNNESDGRTNAMDVAYYGVDDKVDIFANTLAIVNDLTSYTQRGVQEFAIYDDIVCTQFADRFDNGLAGWVAEFTLTTHNDRNRCLFFLVAPTNVNVYLIGECLTGGQYYATFAQSVQPGWVVSTLTEPGLSPTYGNLVCYNISSSVQINESQLNFSNLPVLQLPLEDYVTCNYCELWINPKIWNTTPATWGSAPLADFRTWSTT